MAAKKVQEVSKYEYARIIGARALQLSEGAPLAIKLSEDELEELNYDVIRIAKKEFEKGKIPLEVMENAKPSVIGEEIKDKEEELAEITEKEE